MEKANGSRFADGTAAMQTATPAFGSTVLLFDRHPLFAASLEAMLRDLGAASIHVAEDVAAAFAFAPQPGVSLAVLEWIDGCAQLAALVERLEAAKTAVVLLSVYPRHYIAKAETSRLAVLQKPFADREMQDAIGRVAAG